MNKSFVLLPILILCFAQIIYIKALSIKLLECDQPTNIYESLKCEPKYIPGTIKETNCPDYFNCSHINPAENKCYYRGKYYQNGTDVDSNELLPSCTAPCYCDDDLSFSCAAYDCFWDEDVPEGCRHLYGLNSCCPSSEFDCPDTSQFVCNVNGRNISQGQTYTNPKDHCSTCECHPDVTGEPNDPHCIKYPCYIEVQQNAKIKNYCAAVYKSLSDCCPMDYMCPSHLDRFSSTTGLSALDSGPIEPAATKCEDTNADKVCRYENSCYPIGTMFARLEKSQYQGNTYDYTECQCAIPPYFTCLRSKKKSKCKK